MNTEKKYLSNPSEDSIDFGFNRVKRSEKPKLVQEIFTSVANRYDLMNDIMSGGLHRIWKNLFIKNILLRNNLKLLDMAAGTGDIGIRVLNSSLEKKFSAQIVSVDLTEAMLSIGKSRSIDKGFIDGIHWVNADGLSLPFADKSFDTYTTVFGIRNVANIELALSEAYRILRPGGQFLCLEFSNVSPLLKKPYDWYSFNIIPLIGKIVMDDEDSYRYLVESIRKFPNQEKFVEYCKLSGLTHVKYKNLNGGIATIYSGFKI